MIAWISEQMSDSGLTDAVARDALTAVAALVHAARPLTCDDLAAALAWPGHRVGVARSRRSGGGRSSPAPTLAVERLGSGVQHDHTPA